MESPAIRHRKLVYLILRRYFRKDFKILSRYGYRFEDLAQEGLYAILRAEPHFNPAKFAESTFYGKAVYNWIASRLCVKFIRSQKYRANATALSLDAYVYPGGSGHLDPGDGDVSFVETLRTRDAVSENQVLDGIVLRAALEGGQHD